MAASMENKKSALFVCLENEGSIALRHNKPKIFTHTKKGLYNLSPIAEAVLVHLVNERGLKDEWVIDSAATGDWHRGSSPDSRAQACMKKHRVSMNHSARQLVLDDFHKFQYIFGMDNDNIKNIKRMGPKNYTAKIELLGDYDPEGEHIIRDPYYDSGDEGFEEVYVQCVRCCEAFLDKVMQNN